MYYVQYLGLFLVGGYVADDDYVGDDVRDHDDDVDLSRHNRW
jgi:hypothetical protein